MEHSRYFYKVKLYWHSGLWNETRVRNAVLKNWITAEEYKEITNKDFDNT